MAISFPFSSSVLTSAYGPRTWNGNPTFHTGVDFAVGGNVQVKAADAGTVTRLEYTALKGYQLEITHSASAKTRYHMLRNDLANTVTEGQYVQKGEVVGHIAPVKYSPSAAWTGPHLHWEVWLKTVNSTGTPTGNWFHHDPQKRVTNAGGLNGYEPLNPGGTPTAPATGGGSTPIGSDNVEYKNWSHESKQMFRRDMWGDSLDGGFNWRNSTIIPADIIIQAAQRAGWAADYAAVGEPGVRNDGPLAALVRQGVNSASNAARDSATASRDAALAARDSKYAADYVATGQPGVRNDGQTAALIRQGVNAALAAKLTAADIDAIATAVKNKLQ